MAGGNFFLFTAGLLAAGGIGYYLYKGGYFDKVIQALNDAVGKIGGGNGGGDGCASGKIKCKDGKCDTQAKCDSQAKCKSGEHWNPTSKKCAKTASLAMAYSAPFMGMSSHRGYLVTRY